MWTTTTDGITALRKLLADGPTDKLCDQKIIFGKIDGTNTLFKSFERRRITDFTAPIVSPSPVGVFKNFVRLDPTTDIATDDLTSGSFTLTTAPVDGDELRATYYHQWFLDSEIDDFLQDASRWTGAGSNYVNTPDGLIPAVLHYAAQEAYTRLSLWWSTKISNTYLLDDAPDAQNQGVVESYQKLSEYFHKKSTDLRNEFYSNRQGQALAPRFAVQVGAVRDLMPKR